MYYIIESNRRGVFKLEAFYNLTLAHQFLLDLREMSDGDCTYCIG